MRRLDEGAGGDREVIDDQRGLSSHLSDDLQDLGPLIVCLALLERDGHGGAQARGILAGPLHKTGVRRDHDEVVQLFADNLFTEDRLSIQVVNRDAEEALDLRAGAGRA